MKAIIKIQISKLFTCFNISGKTSKIFLEKFKLAPQLHCLQLLRLLESKTNSDFSAEHFLSCLTDLA